ncbi:EamA family transporter [Streptomyces sp. HSW2009]|uniref:EamA family transporter n=1 Tax=Streptomyces sp. HSW2009 TaxID=3142890 RepID=UPI0032F09C9C
MRASSTKNTGLGLALASALTFGSSGVGAKPLIEAGLDPLHVTWLRAAGAAVLLLPIAWRHRLLVVRRPGLLAGFGLLAVAGVQACYFAAISRIPVGVALLIEYLGPALLLGWVRFVQRRPVSRAAAIGVALAVGGLASVVELWAGLTFDAVGLLLGLGAACCQVGYFLLADQGADDAEPADPLGVVAFGMVVGTLVLTVIARPWGMDWAVLGGRAEMAGARLPAVLLLAWVILVATVTAYVTGVLAVRHLSPQVAGVVAFLEAVVATVLAWVLLAEELGVPQVVGGCVVLVGAFIAQTAAPRRTPQVTVAGAPSATHDRAGHSDVPVAGGHRGTGPGRTGEGTGAGAGAGTELSGDSPTA